MTAADGGSLSPLRLRREESGLQGQFGVYIAQSRTQESEIMTQLGCGGFKKKDLLSSKEIKVWNKPS